MGRIKSALIKRTARTLVKVGKNFEKGFNVNKDILGNSMPSKRMRNRIAGYITRIKILDEKKKVKLSKIV
jgi:ribosomal protein S17E